MSEFVYSRDKRVNYCKYTAQTQVMTIDELHEVHAWCREPQRPGYYTVLLMDKAVSPGDARWNFAFSKKDIAFEFKLRWG